MNKIVEVPAQKVPVYAKVDVLVAGGGPAGFAAGVAASRNGVETLIVEQFNCLGGMATAGLVGPFMRTKGENGGVFKKILDKTIEMGGAAGRSFETEYLKYAMQDMCEKAGTRLLFYTFIESVLVENNQVKGVIIANKAGRQVILCKTLIDATGDGDMAYFAGCDYRKGDEKGNLQPSTMMFRLGGVDTSRIPDKETVGKLLRKARAKGEINLPEYVDWILGRKGSTIQENQVSVNLDTTEGIDGTNPEQLTQATIVSRKRIFECLSFYQKYISGYENCYLLDTSMLYGIRETRRIIGEYYLTYKDVREGRIFEDGIARASFFIDIHGAEISKDIQLWKQKYPVPEDGYEIPYRCLIPKKIDGLMVCGRCISSDRKANASLRIMPTCMATGEAAGVGAAIAIQKGNLPGKIDGKMVRNLLISQGADIKRN